MPNQFRAEREACAARVRAELTEAAPERPYSERDMRRLAFIAGRCSACRACPLIVRALAIMAPQERSPAVVLKLAS